MGFSWIKTSAAFLAATAATTVTAIPHRPAHKPPAFFLAGDSTTAVNGGWGNGLLAPLIEPAWGVNIGQSGATTVSFIAAGNWTNITSHLRQYSKTYDCYVTISVSTQIS
jgi:hypothetical protein